MFDVFLVGDELRVLLCHFHLLLGTGALVIFSSPKKSGYFYIALDNLIFLFGLDFLIISFNLRMILYHLVLPDNILTQGKQEPPQGAKPPPEV